MAASKPKVLVEGRRRFLRLVAEVSGLMAVSGLALAGYLKSARHLVATAIRPPGALAEADFQSASISDRSDSSSWCYRVLFGSAYPGFRLV